MSDDGGLSSRPTARSATTRFKQRITGEIVRADSAGPYVDSGAGETAARLVNKPGSVGAGMVAENLAAGVTAPSLRKLPFKNCKAILQEPSFRQR